MQRKIKLSSITVLLLALTFTIHIHPVSAQAATSFSSLSRVKDPVQIQGFSSFLIDTFLIRSFPVKTMLWPSFGSREQHNINQKPENIRDFLNQLPQTGQDTAIPILPVTVSTPDEDGIIIHIVQYGETLYTISEAYGVPIEEILKNSNLNPSTTDIVEGWRLTIQTATESTPLPSATATLDPGTPTPTQPRPTMTPFPTRTPAPTFTPTTPPSIIHRTLGDAKNVGIGLILVSGMGLAMVIYLGFLKKS